MYIHEVYGHACNLFVLPMYYYSTHPASSKASKRVNEQTEPGRTDERTNEPTNLDERTNEPTNQTWNETNQRICNTQAQHNTAQPYEATAVPLPTLPLHMKQKTPISPNATSPSPLSPRRYRLRLPYVSECDCAQTQVLYDYAVPLALYPAKMYQ